MTQMTARLATLSAIVDLPLIADGDTGYDNPLNVRRAVREYERAGAAASNSRRPALLRCWLRFRIRSYKSLGSRAPGPAGHRPVICARCNQDLWVGQQSP